MNSRVRTGLATIALVGGISLTGAAPAHAAQWTCQPSGSSTSFAVKCWGVPGGEYRAGVQCRVGDIANRLYWRYGVWRVSGGPNASVATCNAGDFSVGQGSISTR